MNRDDLIYRLQKYLLKEYHATNAQEFEILGRALKGCEALAINENGEVMNVYKVSKRPYTNADWRARELIDQTLKELENERTAG